MTATKKRGYTTVLSSNDFMVFKFAGDQFREDAAKEFSEGNYDQAFQDYRNAAKIYSRALVKFGDSLAEKVKKHFKASYDAARVKARQAALYNATEKTPRVLRGLVRKIRGLYILASFLLCLVFSFPKITGNVIGNNSYFSFMGVLFFFLGIVLSYFYIKKRSLMKSLK